MQIKGVIHLSLVSTAMRGIGTLTELYLLNRLGSAGAGRASMLASVCAFFSVVAASGVSFGMTRLCAESTALHKEKELPAIRRAGIAYAAVFGGIAAIALFALSPFLSQMLEPSSPPHEAELRSALCMWAVGMLILAVSSVHHGYLVGRERATHASLCGALGQTVRALLLVLHLSRQAFWPTGGIVRIALCGVCGELVSAVALILCVQGHRKTPRTTNGRPYNQKDTPHTPTAAISLPPWGKGDRAAVDEAFAHTPKDRAQKNKQILYSLCKISLPIGIGSYLRMGLTSISHFLIPRAFGGTESADFAAFGTIHGGVLPLLLLPSAVLTSLAALLLPHVAALRARGEEAALRRLAKKIFSILTLYCLCSALALYALSPLLASRLGTDGTRYLCVLLPLIPCMYFDMIADAFLKGMDAQNASMLYNILDALMCATFAYFLLPRLGIGGYIALLYLSEGGNCLLSVCKMLRLLRKKEQKKQKNEEKSKFFAFF